MDIKAKINELVDKIKSDEGLRNKFMSDPVKAIEELLGVDLPDDQIKQIEEELNEQRVDEVMAEITAQGLTIDQALEKLRS